MADAVRVERLLTDPVVEERYAAPSRDTVSQPLSYRVWRWWSYRRPLAVMVAATGLLYTALALAQNAHLFSYAFDLGVYYEALRGYAHFGLPLVALKGTHYNLLGDHFEPMVAILAPTYWIWPNPDVLLVDQGVLVASSLIPVWMFTERRFGAAPGLGRLTTTRLVAAYALAWEIQSLVGFDFHSLAFAVPILAVAIERADAGRWKAATFWTLSLLLVKEDLSLVVAAFGVYAFLRGRRQLGIFLVAVGFAAFGLLVDVIVPAFAGGVYPHWSYGELGPGPWPALRHAVMHPIATLQVMASPRTKLGLLAWVFLPGALLSLLSPIAILAVPVLLERVLSERPNVWSTGFQYSAPLAPIVGMAVIDGLSRAVRRRGQGQKHKVVLSTASDRRARTGRGLGTLVPTGDRTALAAISLSMIALAISVHFPLSLLVANDFRLFRRDASAAAVETAARMLPRGVTVAASNNLVPPLLNRDNPLVLSPDSVCGSWVLAWTGVPEYPYITRAQMLHQLSSMDGHGWAVVFQRANVELLHRVGSGNGGYPCRRNDPLLAPE
jgi:uncharacterized membrane protein